MNIGLLGFGEVGSTLARCLLEGGHSVSAWDAGFEDPDHQAAKNLDGLSAVNKAKPEILAKDSDVLISAVTAAQAFDALKTATAGLSEEKFVVDLNSVSPREKVRLAALTTTASARFVEAAVMSPISPKALAAPILLGGPHAEGFLRIGQVMGFTSLQVASSDLGQAAATKMCRSVVIKGTEALITESLLAARHYGVEQAVLESLSNLLPRDDWESFAHYMITRSLEHGVRRAEEMCEVARTVTDAGVSPEMSKACATRQNWAAGHVAAMKQDGLGQLLDAVLAEEHMREASINNGI